LLKSGVMSLCRNLRNAGKVAILRYHSIVEPENNFYASSSICVLPDEFETQIRFLSENYNIISLDTVADCIAKQQPLPYRPVVLTFDDGYRDNYQAYQILKRYGARGTFYVAAKCLGGGEPLWLFEVIYLIKKTSRSILKLSVEGEELFFRLESAYKRQCAAREITEIIKCNNLEVREEIRAQLRTQTQDVCDYHEKASQVMLTWEQVQEMSDNGMSIGGHTMSHLNLPNAKYDDAVLEIIDCRVVVEEKTGVPVRHFSYPNGGNYEYYNDSITRIVREAGFSTATTSNNGLVDLSSDLFELSRIRVTSKLSEIIYQIDCEPVVNKVLRIG